MTLDEAIEREKCLADYYWKQASKSHLYDDKLVALKQLDYADMHNNMNIWLTELKNRRENDRR